LTRKATGLVCLVVSSVTVTVTVMAADLKVGDINPPD